MVCGEFMILQNGCSLNRLQPFLYTFLQAAPFGAACFFGDLFYSPFFMAEKEGFELLSPFPILTF